MEKDILKYLEPNVEECLYLYLDIYWYHIGGDTINVWYDEKDGEYSIIVMQYFNCFQIYSRNNDFSAEELLHMVEEQGVDRVFARKGTIEYIAPVFGDGYMEEFGSIIEITKHRDFRDKFSVVEKATVEDLPEITELLLMDEENAVAYTYDELYQSMKNLYDTGMGRSFVIREDGKIIAHAAISAETDIFMIGAYTIVHPDYRDTPVYGMLIDAYFVHKERGEKRYFGFVIDPRRIKMFQALGNKVVSEYGKLIKR